jgi:Na+/melibiose symporter-like transporter
MDGKTGGPRLDYKRTFLIGFGFLATSIAWSMYNANVPLLLNKLGTLSTFTIGVIMTIDNIFALIFQPYFGALSDRTITRWGRRLPFILIGLPICAALFIFIPRMPSLGLMMGVIILFNLVMSTWRSPVIALMPDVTPPPLRSVANGIINLMGGVGCVLAFLVGGMLVNQGGAPLAFAFGSLIMILAWLALILFVREPKILTASEAAEVRAKEEAEEKQDQKSINRSLLLILCSILFWFIGYNAIETFFTLYAVNVLGVREGSASIMLTFFSLALVIGAVPAGFIGTKFGRRRTILAGLTGIIALFTVMVIVSFSAGGAAGAGLAMIIRILLILAGFSWALININSLPMVVEIAKSSRIGKYTGYYYFFSASAAILAPPLFGLVRDLTGNYAMLFVFSTVAFLAALGCMLFVRHGEVEYTQEQVISEAKAIEG